MYRSHTCNQLQKTDIEKTVTLSGWVHRRRDHGGLIFIDLRDRYGLTQIVSDPEHNQTVHEQMNHLRSEYVIKITGKVRNRPNGMTNSQLSTGEIEILVDTLEILNEAITPPFEIDNEKNVNEEIRLQYRYLDIRRERMKNNLLRRHRFIKIVRDLCDEQNFVEIETPILIKGTPEGSREYIVPSRLYPGKFFVLPQSPQQLKQLLMVAGMDRYFQIARCFRDEDQRGDRQPEFTQLDMEMSFVDENDVMDTNEKIMLEVFKKMATNKTILKIPFPKLTWQEAMGRYGSDKPDLRFSMEIKDITAGVKEENFEIFQNVIKAGGVIKALKIKNGAKFSRKEIDTFIELAKTYGAKGLSYLIMTQEGPKSSLLKFLTDQGKSIIELTEAQTGDIIFIAADQFEVACTALGQIRLACGDYFKLRDPNILSFCWVTHFPLLEFSKEEQRYVAAHHPFTSPQEEDLPLLETAPGKVKAKAYDLALNGSEIAGGSIRIHKPELQRQIFKILGISPEDAERRFGHLLKAFQYGAPPHGGIAWGLDRIIMLLQDEPNIREVIAFPKEPKI